MYLSLPYFVQSAVTDGAALPVYAFVGSAVGAISIMGGTYAILPAYEADLFGAKNIGATHGAMMIYSAAAALLGPAMLLQLRQFSEHSAIHDLITKVILDAWFLLIVCMLLTSNTDRFLRKIFLECLEQQKSKQLH